MFMVHVRWGIVPFMSMWSHRIFLLEGVVQGMGLRPALHRLATEKGVGGCVWNRPNGVHLEITGEDAACDAMDASLRSTLPGFGGSIRITEQSRRTVGPAPEKLVFKIRPSETEGVRQPVLTPDLALCPECRAELLDPSNRRHGYPFIACCRCGPRLTVLHAPPYDRERSTFSDFPMCSACQAEYDDPADRRYHAECMVCPDCGPRLEWLDAAGAPIPDVPSPLRAARASLAVGEIVAVRGMGGFLLACDATNRETVQRLRKRKHRPDKPLAVLAPDLDTIRAQCIVPPAAEALLQSSAAPIVILEMRKDTTLPMDLLSPDTNTLGVMLPATPLQLLLAQPLAGNPVPVLPWLVMTSGNISGEPLCLTRAEAADRLRGIADRILDHNRDILRRMDDSVAVLRDGAPQIWRRSRGYAPLAIPLRSAGSVVSWGAGAQWKNTVALASGTSVYLSPHIGDLDTAGSLDLWSDWARALPEYTGCTPAIIAVDAHPDMESTHAGRRLGQTRGLPVVPIQHHHAHAAAALAEAGWDTGLALVFDGLGYGLDGTLWGAELFHVGRGYDMNRVATFDAVPLPGGDAATREPRRQLWGRWHAAGITSPSRAACAAAGIDPDAEGAVWTRLIEKNIHCPRTRAAGRLFDSAAAMLGASPPRIHYEGQAAIRLETLAKTADSAAPLCFREREFTFTVDAAGMASIQWSPLFRRWAESPPPPPAHASEAYAFHAAVAAAAVRMARHGHSRTGERRIALTGGVFMNGLLLEMAVRALRELDFAVFIPRLVPPNDGGISFGQVVLASQMPTAGLHPPSDGESKPISPATP